MKLLEALQLFLQQAIQTTVTAVIFFSILFFIAFVVCMFIDDIKAYGGLKNYLFRKSSEDKELNDGQADN